MSGLVRVIIHWSAGGYKADKISKEHYHFCVEGDGTVVRGDCTPEDNINVNDHRYAAHTRGANSGSIGISMMGMMDAQGPGKLGKYPLTKAQWDACMKKVAQLCKQYKIAVTPRTVLTHAEVQGTLGIPQKGKVDIAFAVPGRADLKGPKACGDYIRQEVKALM